MSVPEGMMRVVTTRRDVWFAVSAMEYLIKGKTPPAGFLEVLANSVKPALNAYLEVTDGPPPVNFPSDAASQEGVGRHAAQ